MLKMMENRKKYYKIIVIIVNHAKLRQNGAIDMERQKYARNSTKTGPSV